MERRKKITNYTVWMDTKLGEGAFGKVYYGQHDETKKKVAIKMLEKAKIDKDQYYKNALFSEIDILKCLKSSNIVQFLDVMESSNYYYIVQQFCNGGELRKHMNKIGQLPQKQAIGILKQICNGFYQLAKQGVIHRDLKPENILMNDSSVKIADFGLSKKSFKGLNNKTVVGTPLYMSLQLLMAAPYSSKCDIWSLGCVFYQMLHGKTPWTANSQYQLIMKIQTSQLNFRSDLSQSTKDFLRKCLALQQNDRLSWNEVFSHSILQGNYGKQSTVQNKFKSLMNHLRYMIKTRNIDLQKYFSNMKFKKNGFMNYQSFRNLILYIDDRIPDDEAKYIYERIAIKSDMGLSYDQVQKTLMKFGIPISTLKMKSQNILYDESPKKFRNSGQNQDSMAYKQQINSKLSNTLFKLKEKLESKKMSIYEVFDAYGWKQKGYLNQSDFGKLLKLVDSSYSQKQIHTAFQIIDSRSIGTISVEGFVKFFYSAIQNSNVSQNQNYNRSNAHSNSLSPKNTSNYPSQNPNENLLRGMIAPSINNFALNPQKVTNDYSNPIKRKSSFNSGVNGWF